MAPGEMNDGEALAFTRAPLTGAGVDKPPVRRSQLDGYDQPIERLSQTRHNARFREEFRSPAKFSRRAPRPLPDVERLGG